MKGEGLDNGVTPVLQFFPLMLAIAVVPSDFEGIPTYAQPLGCPLPVYLSFMIATDIAHTPYTKQLRCPDLRRESR